MKSHAQRPDVLIVAAVVLLLALGVVTVMSAASVTDLLQYNDPYYHVKRQLVWAVLGVIAMTVLARVDYRLLRALTLPALAGAFLLLVLVLFVGSAAGGARRWLGFGFISVQPSEVAKLALVMYTAAYVAQRRNDMHRFFSGLLPPLVITGAACLLILLEPDFGTAAMIALIVVVMLYAGGASPGQLLAVGVAAAPLAAYLIVSEPYRLRRLLAFVDPWADRMDSGWNVVQSLLAIGSGGLFGLGLGESRQKYLYVPEQHTDFIFAILGEELGFVGTTTVLLLFALLGWRGLRAAMRAPDMYGTMLAVGITAMIVLQAFVNIGVVTGSLPTTGITLPFISVGGSSLVVTMAGVGVLLNISSQGTKV
ncbi:MAG: putative lipid II flippase FtsW [Limnochordales bacterium]|nr:putative lipid II flippase FtsW [Bacillota bacterium]